jgi:hypothetical protein
MEPPSVRRDRLGQSGESSAADPAAAAGAATRCRSGRLDAASMPLRRRPDRRLGRGGSLDAEFRVDVAWAHLL